MAHLRHPRDRHRLFVAVLTTLLVQVVAGCDAPQPVPSPPLTMVVGPTPRIGDEPVIRPAGRLGAVPDRVVVELLRPLGEPATGTHPSGVTATLDPAHDGILEWSGRSTLTFRPSESLRPGTDYQFELRSDLVGEVGPGSWRATFSTPDLRYLRAELVEVEYDRERARIDVVFSAPVDPEEVGRRLTTDIVDRHGRRRAVHLYGYEAGPHPGTVRVWLTHRDVAPGRRLAVMLDAGVPASDYPDLTTDAARSEIRLPDDATVTIRAIVPIETSGGWALEVVCDDRSVEARRWYWDRQTGRGYGRLSARCQPATADLAKRLHIEPAVDLVPAPSGGGFRLLGELERGTYTVRLDGGLTTIDGGTLLSGYEASVQIPARSAHLAFATQGRFLPRSAWRELPLRHLNIDEITVRVRHVPPENLVFWLTEPQGEATTDRTGNTLATTSIDLAAPPDEELVTSIDVASLAPAETKGLFEVMAEGAGTRAAARLMLTDLQVIAKRAGLDSAGWPASVLVGLVDSHDLDPVAGADVSLVRKSGATLGRCATGRDGLCTIVPESPDSDRSPPFAVVAQTDDDLVVMRFDDLEASIGEARVGGEPFTLETPYRAAAFSDRGVYRPGEIAHLTALVRDDQLDAQAGLPVQLRIVDARGQLVRDDRLETSSGGLVTASIDLPPFASTGRWEARIVIADRAAATLPFQVEEIVPERMEVDVSSDVTTIDETEAIEATVLARYLFGGVPASHRVDLECLRRPGRFTPPSVPGLAYGPWPFPDDPEATTTVTTASAVLDEQGRGRLTCPLGEQVDRTTEIELRASVFEAGSGRTSTGRSTVFVHPEHYIGLAAEVESVRAGGTVPVHGRIVTADGSPIEQSTGLTVSLYRLEEEYGWTYDPALGRDRYRRYRRPVLESRRSIDAEHGQFRAELAVATGAPEFLVEVSSAESLTSLAIQGDGSRWWWRGRSESYDTTPRPGQPRWLELRAEDRVRRGDPIEVALETPFAGRALVAIETDEVVWAEWRDVEAGPVRWSLPNEASTPNVYVTVLLLKDPHLESAEAYLPDRAFGVRSITIEPTDVEHEVRLDHPSELRSGAPLELKLDLGPLDGPTFATIAVVDEGLLSLTGFETPDPLSQILARRSLGVRTAETVGWTLALPGPAGAESPGGDKAESLDRIVAVEPVALWSGVVAIPRSGSTTVRFEVPPYQGRLRVMAITTGPRRIGRAESRILVRDPVVLQATLPRFALPGDEIVVPARLSNRSGEIQRIEVSIDAEMDTRAGASASADVETSSEPIVLEDGESATRLAIVRFGPSPGAVRIRVRAATEGSEITTTATVPVIPKGPLTRRQKRIALRSGRNDLRPGFAGWEPFTDRSTVRITANPYADVLGHLRHLVRYPYGCVEQTTSSTRPLLWLSELMSRLEPELVEERPIDEMIRAGIERLLSMQTPSGGLGYWPGADRPSAWGTAYATHLLLEARELGHPVPTNRLDEIVGWIGRELERAGHGDRAEVGDEQTEAYLHYVLARSGRGRKGRIAELVTAIGTPRDERERESLFLLQAAALLAGDHRWEDALRRPDLSPLTDLRIDGWSFYSDRRRRGLMLSVLVDLFGPENAPTDLADLVAEGLRGRSSHHFSTQEIAWAVGGLGRLVQSPPNRWSEPVLRVGGRIVTPAGVVLGADEEQDGRPTPTWTLYRASEASDVTIEAEIEGDGPLFAIIDTEGVATDPGDREVGGLELRRSWWRESGEALEAGDIVGLGQLVFVQLDLVNRTGEGMTNLALVDRIPAGLEIENPRLSRGYVPDWHDDATDWVPEHLEVRDDRLEVFGHLDPGEARSVLYAVRAVSAGRFSVPPASVEAMYDPRLGARTEATALEIHRGGGE